MARPHKIGLDYFPLDVDFFSDTKIKRLIRYCTAEAILVYMSLLTEIYKQGYFLEYNEDLIFDISDIVKLEETRVENVIKKCLELDLFSEKFFWENKVLTSRGIQSRYSEVCKQSKRFSKIGLYNLIETPVSSEETPVSSEETPVSSEETPVSSELSAQRKEKESKGNEIEKKQKENSISPSTPPVDFETIQKKFSDQMLWNYSLEHHKISENQRFELLKRFLELKADDHAKLVSVDYSDILKNFYYWIPKYLSILEKEKSSAKKESFNQSRNATTAVIPIKSGGFGKLSSKPTQAEAAQARFERGMARHQSASQLRDERNEVAAESYERLSRLFPDQSD